MTGIELLRKFAETRPPTVVTCSQLPDALGKKCNDFKNCNDCHMFVCNAIADQIEREIDKAVADEVADTMSAYEMNTNARWYSAVEDGADSDCKAEYELINRYWLPRPRFEDGEPVQFGDRFVANTGEVRQVARITCLDNGRYVLISEYGHRYIVGKEKADGKRVKRPEPPDTWEKLAADIERCGDSCAYFGVSSCKGCPCHGADDACMVIVMRDVLGRAKKLAGVE